MRGSIPRVPPPKGSVPGPRSGLSGGFTGGPGGHDPGAVTATDVRNKRFGVTRLQTGYDDEEVDQFLAEVEAELDRLDRENAELRTRLAEFSRSWERDPARFSAGVTPVDRWPVDQVSVEWMSAERAPIEGLPVEGTPTEAMRAGGPLHAGGSLRAERGPVSGYGAGAAPGYGAVSAPRHSPSRSRRQWMEADIPTAVPLYAEVGLSIRICSDSSGFVGGQSRGIPITLIAQTRYEMAGTSPLQQSVLVPESGGSSDAVRFTFHATYPGQYSVRVSAFAGGTFLGDLTAELSVERSGRLARGEVRTAELEELRAAPGEVTLHIRNDGAQYIFQFLSELYVMEPVVARALTDRAFEPTQRMAEALRMGVMERNARSALEQAGAGLWFDMVPDLVKEQFWHLRDSITAFSVLGEQDALPWEALYPLARGESSGFLAEQFPVLRRIAGQRPFRRISMHPPLFVVPPAADGQPGSAGLEISTLRRRLGAGAGTVDDMDRLLDLIDAGDFGLLHFACHETFRPDTAGSSVVMGGGRLIPAFLNPAVVSRSLGNQHPLVFLNSSRSATAVPEYTKLSGWAEQFITAGAAAFVGTSWPVRPESATAFAEAFYGALQEGQPLGAAASDARKAAADPAEPSWLAYSVYGDPIASALG
ncbi:MAG: CHAT domain-containing protein [Trebonia sp.]